MRYKLIMPLSIFLVGCQFNKSKESLEGKLFEDTTANFTEKIIDFPEYELNARDTIKQVTPGGIKIEKIYLGDFIFDDKKYQVISESKLIPVAIGYRGRSALHLYNKHSDTITYQVDSKSDLPIDIYKNWFVFRTEEIVFVKPYLIEKEVICFKGDEVPCFLN